MTAPLSPTDPPPALEEFGAPHPAIGPESALAPFRWPVFRNIWFANLASALGSMIQMIAAAWLMTELTPSHLLVALVQASVAIPVLAFGVIAGVIADNHDRRKVMLVANCGMLVLSAMLAALAWLDLVQPWSLLLFTLLIGSGFALNGPAWQASVRMQVPRADLPQAISLNSIAFNAARSVGPAIGGLILSASGPELAFSVNAASYLVMIVVLIRWRARPTGRAQRQKVAPALAEGLGYVARNSPLRRVAGRGLALGLGTVSFQALVPLVTRERIGGDEVALGMVLGSFGIGSIAVAFSIGRVRRAIGPEAVVSLATLASAAAAVILALADTLVMGILAAFIAGAGQVSAMTSLNVSMQMRSPEAILGRCLAIFQAMVFGGMAIGSWVWGSISDVYGIQHALLASAAWLVLSLAVLRLAAPMPGIGEGTHHNR